MSILKNPLLATGDVESAEALVDQGLVSSPERPTNQCGQQCNYRRTALKVVLLVLGVAATIAVAIVAYDIDNADRGHTKNVMHRALREGRSDPHKFVFTPSLKASFLRDSQGWLWERYQKDSNRLAAALSRDESDDPFETRDPFQAYSETYADYVTDLDVMQTEFMKEFIDKDALLIS